MLIQFLTDSIFP